MLGGPAQVERPPVHHQQDDRGAGRDDGLQQFELTSGQLQRRPRRHLADHVLPLADHDDRDVGAGGEVDGPPELGVLVEALGVARGVAAEHVEHRRELALHHAARRGRSSTRTPVADLARGCRRAR